MNVPTWLNASQIIVLLLYKSGLPDLWMAIKQGFPTFKTEITVLHCLKLPVHMFMFFIHCNIAFLL